jgi:hypothetical protein
MPQLLVGLAGAALVMALDAVHYAPLSATAAPLPTPVRWGVRYVTVTSILLLSAFYGPAQQFLYFRF